MVVVAKPSGSQVPAHLRPVRLLKRCRASFTGAGREGARRTRAPVLVFLIFQLNGLSSTGPTQIGPSFQSASVCLQDSGWSRPRHGVELSAWPPAQPLPHALQFLFQSRARVASLRPKLPLHTLPRCRTYRTAGTAIPHFVLLPFHLACVSNRERRTCSSVPTRSPCTTSIFRPFFPLQLALGHSRCLAPTCFRRFSHALSL